jgi:hypothetical protein
MREHIYKKKKSMVTVCQIEKYTKVDAELELWGWCDYWFVCYRKGGGLNNANTNYILPTVSEN